LLREGLDLPEVSLVAILDADKEGFLRNETSLIQTIGRAARNAEGEVIMYAERVTDSMQRAIDETNRRRTLQEAYNTEHGIIPRTIQKSIRDVIEATKEYREEANGDGLQGLDIKEQIEQYTEEMRLAAKNLDFERAAYLRDKITELKIKVKTNG